MCGRYYTDDGTDEAIERLVTEISENYVRQAAGDVHPMDRAAVIVNGKRDPDALRLETMTWGFPGAELRGDTDDRRSGGLLINARAETALNKPSFTESILERRAVMPAAGFYEWDREKEKVTFTVEDRPIFYLAGFYRKFEGQNRFIILTTEANASMRKVHDRMPVIFTEDEARVWVRSEEKTEERIGKIRYMIERNGPELTAHKKYEQFTLFG